MILWKLLSYITIRILLIVDILVIFLGNGKVGTKRVTKGVIEDKKCVSFYLD